jgi:hypothetical protein
MGAAGPFPFLDGLVLRPAACNAAEAGHQDRLPIVSTMASGDSGFLGVRARQFNAALILMGQLGPCRQLSWRGSVSMLLQTLVTGASVIRRLH